MFIKKEVEYIKSNYGHIEAFIQKHLNRSFGQTRGLPVDMICICFMNTSLYMSKPVFRLCFYKDTEIWENPILEYEMPADWLFKEWPSEFDSEEEYIKNRKQIRPLLIYASSVFKYSLAQCYRFSNYEKMQKGEELYICFGEYKDWQFPIYIDRPELDIFQNPEDEPLVFRRFNKKVYKNKEFENMDLTSSEFSDCVFNNVKFNDVILNDANFENCQFKNVIYEGCKLYGAIHTNCDFRDIKYINTHFTLNNSSPETLTGIYRECAFADCRQENIDYNNSDTEGVLVL